MLDLLSYPQQKRRQVCFYNLILLFEAGIKLLSDIQKEDAERHPPFLLDRFSYLVQQQCFASS